MSRTIKLSVHGNYRINERVKNTTIKNRTLIRNVLKNGYSKNKYKGKFYNYLLRKEKLKNIRVKVYNEEIYVFASRNHQKLVTTYPVPNFFKPTSKYEVDKNDTRFMGKIVSSEGSVGVSYDDEYVFGLPILHYRLGSTVFLLFDGKNSYKVIDISKVKSIKTTKGEYFRI